MLLTRPTKLTRQTLTPDARVIVHPDSLHSGIRTVRIITPTPDLCAGNQIYIGLDVNTEELGPDMLYKLVPIAPNLPIPFRLRPEQWVVAAVEGPSVTLGVFVEYEDE